MNRCRRLLAHPRFPLVAALVAAALTLASVRTGLALDDYGHLLRVVRPDVIPGRFDGPWDLYRFQTGEAVQWRLLVQNAIEPWWTEPTLKLAFFRPLPSLSLWVDYAWLHAPLAWMHLENVVAYALAVFAAGTLYRRVLGAGVPTGLAALLFAVDDAHGMPVGWIAHRHTMMAFALGCAALAAHDRWRRGGWRAGALVGPALFVTALGCGEVALATLGYLAAHALFLDAGDRRARLRAVAPYALVFAAWAMAYRVLDYGATGSSFYVDPARHPLAFARALVARAPVMAVAQLALLPSELLSNLPTATMYGVAAIGGVVAFALGGALFHGARSEPSARFWAFGALVSIVPVCATLPSDRNLFFPGLGAMALVAVFLTRPADACARLGWRIARRAACAVFVTAHLVVAPVLLPLRTLVVPAVYGSMIDRADRSLPRSPDGVTVIVASPDPLVPFYVLELDGVRGRPRIPVVHLLAVDTHGQLVLRRVGSRAVEVQLEDGFLHDPYSLLFRDDAHSMHVGQSVETSGMTATVLSVTADGRPATVRFDFDRDLDGADVSWVTWRGARFEPYALPARGESRESPPIDPTAALLGL